MKTVGKAFDILETIMKSGDPIGLTDLAKMTGLNRTTTYRISSFLTKRGYLYQKKKGDKYSLGLKFLQYNKASNFATTIKEQSLPYMQNLCDEISETVNIAILDGIEAICVGVVAADRILQVIPGSVNLYPLHSTAIGKVFLAYFPEDKVKEFVSIRGLKAYTDNTITNMDRLMREIEDIRHEGVAFDDEEYSLGIRSAAAPVRDAKENVLASISFAGPSVRISKMRMIQLAPMVKNCALKISQSMGYQGKLEI